MVPCVEIFKTPLTPVELFYIFRNEPHSFFLDSSQISAALGRWSFIGSCPFLVFKSKGYAVCIKKGATTQRLISPNPFLDLQSLFERFSLERPAKEKIPFLTGGVGYFAYDLKDFVEDLPDAAYDDLQMPDCVIGFYDAIIAYDHLSATCFLVSSGFPETDARKQRANAQENLRRLRLKLYHADKYAFSVSGVQANVHGRYNLPRSNFTKSAYKRAVDKAKQYIQKGDIYQVNLSQRFCADVNGKNPFRLYRNLRSISPAPFSAYLKCDDITILSSSPERFLRKAGRYIETRPIKGTRPRGKDDNEDRSMANELRSSEKDAAEHVMIVDLERNDLGRICRYGSVAPQDFITMERYATVFHLVSTVSGCLRKRVTPIDCLQATFPGGSITGAPKVRAMEIIEELEPVKRSVYTGAIGYVGFDGAMDTSVVIRTSLLKGNKIYFHVGGGIVADSDPDAEYQETLDKAEGMIRALRATGIVCKKRSNIKSECAA